MSDKRDNPSSTAKRDNALQMNEDISDYPMLGKQGGEQSQSASSNTTASKSQQTDLDWDSGMENTSVAPIMRRKETEENARLHPELAAESGIGRGR